MNAADWMMLVECQVALEREAEYWRVRSLNTYTKSDEQTYLTRSQSRQELSDRLREFMARRKDEAPPA